MNVTARVIGYRGYRIVLPHPRRHLAKCRLSYVKVILPLDDAEGTGARFGTFQFLRRSKRARDKALARARARIDLLLANEERMYGWRS